MNLGIPSKSGAYVITGPTSGIGLCTAIELSAHGTVILAGRSESKLKQVEERIAKLGRRAVTVICDVSELESVQRAAVQIAALRLPIKGLVNNAGIMPNRESKTARGWDMTFATNHLGPFLLTDLLMPHLCDRANVVFVVSAIEDPERKPAKLVGMRGGRFLSVEASVRAEWQPGGAKAPGIDGYATSKQCSLAATLMLAREQPQLLFSAVEPGIIANTGLAGANAFMRFVFNLICKWVPPFSSYSSTPERAARVIADIVTKNTSRSGVYYDEKGQPMTGSPRAHDPAFQARVVEQTRAFLANVVDNYGKNSTVAQ
jgi:NAD(P)-dependent dehydrogenase (short-subunit alcohol dehydrogenase family)